MIYLAVAYKYAPTGRIIAREEWIILAKSEAEARNRLTKIPGLAIVGLKQCDNGTMARIESKFL